MALPQAESSMPPIQVRMPRSWQKRAISIASAKPETRGGLMLMMRRSSAPFRSQRRPPLARRAGMDAFVQADGRLQLPGDLAVEDDVVVEEGLLDEEEVEVVQRLQAPPVLHGVGGVGVDLEQDVREARAQRGGDLDVEPRPDFHLQAPVAQVDGALGQVEDLGEGLAADADPDRKRAPLAAPELPERLARALGEDVPHGGFDAALGEDRALDPGVALPQRCDVVDWPAVALVARHAGQDERLAAR